MKFSSLILHLSSFCLCALLSAQTPPPSWWSEYNLTDANPANDTAVATVGQAKHVFTKANDYLDTALASVGGSGAAIDQIETQTWFTDTTNDNQALLIGQLKTFAAPFYDRLNSADVDFDTTAMVTTGDPSIYPWIEPPSDATIDKQLATLGQLKFVFSFNLENWVPPIMDSDNDGLPDVWEQRIVDADPDDQILSIADVLGDGNFDGDAFTDLEEYQQDTDPIDYYNSDNATYAVVPALVILNGDLQRVSHGGVSPQAITAQVVNADGSNTPLENAPIFLRSNDLVTYLSTSTDFSGEASTLVVRTDSNGMVSFWIKNNTSI